MALNPFKLAKAIPLARLVAAAQVVMLARRHWHRLDADERHRVVTLVRYAGTHRGHLSPDERVELAQLIAKADPRLFVGLVAERFSPVRLPRRVVQGKH